MAGPASRIGASFLAPVALLVLLACALPGLALATETPVAGRVAALLASQETEAAKFLWIDLKDPAISAPLPDPRLGATIRIHGGPESGQCSARINLDPSGWEERRRNGARWGYRYRARRTGSEGIRSVTLRPGHIAIWGRGSELPCGLSADAQREPLSIEFQTADQRYCAEFGGTVWKNELGHFVARNSAAPAACMPRRMNVVLIFADDLGFNDLGVQGSETIPTPQIDRLATEGLRFTNAYATAASCSPSRAALLTGRYQQRFGFEFNTPEHGGLDPTTTTIAEALHDAGYATGIVGKWHLGTRDQYHPIEHGFDEFFGFLGGSHPYFPQTVAHRPVSQTINRGKERANETEYLTDAFAREAVSFIERHRTTPFFLYVPFNAVHGPISASQEYYAMTSALDDAVGEIVQAVEDQGLAEDTLIVFTNDNGGQLPWSDNAPLRLGKVFLFEGGARVPMIIRWPGVTTAGTEHHDAVSLLDLFPTLLTAANVAPPGEIELDGTDLSPFILGDETGASQEYLFWRTGPNRAVRNGDFKLIRACNPYIGTCNVWLFDLASDPGEVNNLAEHRPWLRYRLILALDEWESELAPPIWPGKMYFFSIIDGMQYGYHL